MTLTHKWTLEDHWVLVLNISAEQLYLSQWNPKEATYHTTPVLQGVMVFESERKARVVADQIACFTFGKLNATTFKLEPAADYLDFRYQYDIETNTLHYALVPKEDGGVSLMDFLKDEIEHLKNEIGEQQTEIKETKKDSVRELKRMLREYEEEVLCFEEDTLFQLGHYEERIELLQQGIKTLEKLLPKKIVKKKTTKKAVRVKR